jgi:DNA-binding protein HU-beta
MNKADLIEKIRADYDLTRVLARDIVENVFDTLASSIQSGDEVSISNFGAFKVVDRAARKGRNPATGEAIKIAASRSVKFRPAAPLKAAVNTKRRSSKKSSKKRA